MGFSHSVRKDFFRRDSKPVTALLHYKIVKYGRRYEIEGLSSFQTK